MGLRDLFGKKESVPEHKSRSLSFDDVGPWAKKTEAEIAELIVSQAAPHGAQIDELFEDVASIVQELDEKELKEELIKRLETITISSKKAYCSAMSSLLAKRPLYDAATPDDIKVYSLAVQDTLLQINKTATSKGRYLAFAFESEVKEMGRILKQIAMEANELSTLHASSEGRWHAAETIANLHEEYAGLDEDALKGTMRRAEQAIAELKEGAKAASKALQQYEEGETARSHREDIAALEAIDDREHEQNLALYEYIGPVRRVVKKFKNAVDRGGIALPPDEYALMEGMADRPVLTLVAEGGLATCKSLMGYLIDSLEQGAVQEKQSRLDKALSRSKDIIHGGMDDMVIQYQATLSDQRALRKALETYSDPQLNALKKRVDEVARELLLAEEDLGGRTDDLAAAEKRRAHIKAEIKRLISEFYEEITLNF